MKGVSIEFNNIANEATKRARVRKKDMQCVDSAVSLNKRPEAGSVVGASGGP